jgi:hypothetical protein
MLMKERVNYSTGGCGAQNRLVMLAVAALMAVMPALTGCPMDSGDGDDSVSLIKWQAVADSAFTGEVNFITYSNGKFLAGGRNGGAAYSADGVTWTTLNGEEWFAANQMFRPKYLNGKFWAGGNDTKLANSSDGVNWDTVTVTGVTDFHFYDIAYGAGKYVTVSSAGKTAYSTDGVAWTPNTQTPGIFKHITPATDPEDPPISAPVNINSIVFADGKFAAVGQSGTSAVSSDGINWTDTGTGAAGTYEIFGNTSVGNTGIKMVAYGNGKFVVAGQGKVAISTHGTEWSLIDLSTFIDGTTSIGWLNCVIFADGRFVAGGANGRLIYSKDGINWTRATQTEAIFGTNYINGVAFGGGKFVAVGGGDSRIAYTVP